MKKYLVVIFVVLFALTLVSCGASPTAMKVGGNSIDASEYAYYLNYNRLNLDNFGSGTLVLSEQDLLTQAHAQTKQHIINAEVVRIKCKELGLEITKANAEQMKESKDGLIESFGGLAGYRDYLKQNALTDRLYDKLQENSHYYALLYDHISAGESVTNDQELRQFFADNYIKVKYICFSAFDEEGQALDSEGLDALLETAEGVLAQINNQEITMDAAIAQYNDDEIMASNPSGLILCTQDAAVPEYSSDAFSQAAGYIGGVYAYSDGYYIVQTLAVDISYYDEHHDEISIAASDWAFTRYLNEAKATISVSENKVCQKINFENIDKYVK